MTTTLIHLQSLLEIFEGRKEDYISLADPKIIETIRGLLHFIDTGEMPSVGDGTSERERRLVFLASMRELSMAQHFELLAFVRDHSSSDGEDT